MSSSHGNGQPVNIGASGGQAGIYRVGSLRYTRSGLAMVFFWLLWGDFIWTLMSAVLGNIMPFLLKDLGASNETLQLLNRSLAYIITFALSPAVSYRSDRYRGAMGRRIPYLLWSTPFVSLFLILIGFYREISLWLTGADGTFFGLDISVMYVAVIAVLLVAYDVAGIFVNTVYWYLFNDVVPEIMLSRFLSLFRIVGTAAGAMFSYWVFPIVLSTQELVPGLDNFKFVTVSAGVLYLVGFMLMCIYVKEGKYPPPAPLIGERKGQKGPVEAALIGVGLGGLGRKIDSVVNQVRTFSKECFVHRFYWYFFLTNTCLFVSWQSNTFFGLRNRDSLGIDMEEIGWLVALTMIVSCIIYYPAGWLADKFHPVRVYMITIVLSILAPLSQCIWIFTDFGHKWNLYGQIIIAIAFLPIEAVRNSAELPMYMRLLPKERYGQFCSANDMIRAFVMAGGAWLSGVMIDVLSRGGFGIAAMGDWAYRYYAVWSVAWTIPAILFFWLVQKEWKKRGGAKGYTPPEA